MIRAYANTISNILSNEKSIKKDTLFKRMNIKESEFNEALNFLLDHNFVKLEAISDGLFETIIVHYEGNWMCINDKIKEKLGLKTFDEVERKLNLKNQTLKVWLSNKSKTNSKVEKALLRLGFLNEDLRLSKRLKDLKLKHKKFTALVEEKTKTIQEISELLKEIDEVAWKPH